MKRKQISLYLDEDQVKTLKHLAVDKETSVSELLRQIINNYLEQVDKD